MFRKVFTGLQRFAPSLRLQIAPTLRLQTSVNSLPSVNALPKRNLFTTPAVFNYDKDIDGIKFFSQNKKFFVDIKEADGGSGRYLKISELSNHKRSTLKIEGEDVPTFLKELVKMAEPDSARHVQIDSKSPRKKWYEVEINLFSGPNSDDERYKSWAITEHHHTGKKFRVFVPGEVWPQMIQNIATLSKEHIPDMDSAEE